MIELKIPFTNPGNYVFDPLTVEVIDGNGQLKSRLPISNEIFYAGIFTTINGDRGAGDLTGAQTGGVVANAGNLEFLGEAVKFIDYGSDNLVTLAKQGAIKVRVKFNYNGFPPSVKTLFSISNNDGKNKIELSHKADGNLQLKFIDDTLSETIDNDLGLFPADNSVFFEFELNFNFNDLGGGDGLTQLYINGIKFGVDFPEAISRTFVIDQFRFGSDVTGTDKADFVIDFIQVFDTVQHTADFTPGIVPETNFSINDDLLNANAVALMDTLNSVTADETKPASTDIGFILTRDGVPSWFNGAAWVTSDLSFSQSNTAAIINTNAASFISVQTSVGLIIVLRSTLGTGTPVLNEFIFNYSLAGYTPDVINKSLIKGNIIDGAGAGIAKEVKVFLSRDFTKYKLNTTINKSDTAQEFTPRADDGFFQISLIENDNMEPAATWIFEYSDGNRESVTVKDLATQNYAQLERGYKSNI